MSPKPTVAISFFEGGWCFVHLPKNAVDIWVRVKPEGISRKNVLDFSNLRFKIVELRLDSGENKLDPNFVRAIPFSAIESLINREGLYLWETWNLKADFEKVRKQERPRVSFDKVKRLKLSKPQGRLLTDDFLKQVSAFYIQSVEIGENPIVAMSEVADVAYKTAESWARKARAKGFLSRGDAGKVS